MVHKEKDWSCIKVTQDNILEVLKFVDLEGELKGTQEQLVSFVKLNGIPVETKNGIELVTIDDFVVESKGKFYVIIDPQD